MRLVQSLLTFLTLLIALSFLPSADAQEPEKKPDDKPAFKRRDTASDEDLRKQLLLIPELGFDQTGASVVYNPIRNPKSKLKDISALPPDYGLRVYNQLALSFKQGDRAALPWKMGLDCQLGKETAERLQVFSVNLRLYMRQATPANDIRPDPEKLRQSIMGAGIQVKGRDTPMEWAQPEAIPTLVQMLQTENTPIRMLLVELLANIKGKEASAALAQRALFDLSPPVREKAVESLSTRPDKEFQQVLIDGLRWPWAPVSDHAAEAISALQLKGIVPELIGLLKQQDPNLPFQGEKKVHFVREMIRVNHLSNCALCHAISTSKEDLVRGRVPIPGEESPPLYYAATTGIFVRADTTFLRQDFSVVQPVTTPLKWPGHQRYDYLLRTRNATPKEVKLYQGIQKENQLAVTYPQRESLLFALREITKSDLGSQVEPWLKLLDPLDSKKLLNPLGKEN